MEFNWHLKDYIVAALQKPSRKIAGFLAALGLVGVTSSAPTWPLFLDLDFEAKSCSKDGDVVTLESNTKVVVARRYGSRVHENFNRISQSIADNYKVIVSNPLGETFSMSSNQAILNLAHNKEKMGRISDYNRVSITVIVKKAFSDSHIPVDSVEVSKPAIHLKDREFETGDKNHCETPSHDLMT